MAGITCVNINKVTTKKKYLLGTSNTFNSKFYYANHYNTLI